MMLGKRSRPPMRRTTSMTEFAFDLSAPPETNQPTHQLITQPPPEAPVAAPRVGRRNSGDFQGIETVSFLRACGLCKRRLSPGRDIYIYMGDTAFCSLECRHQQMSLDERKAKCLTASMKKEAQLATTAGSESCSGSETMAVA